MPGSAGGPSSPPGRHRQRVERSAPAPAPPPAGCRVVSARRAPARSASTFGEADSVIVGALAVVNASGAVIDPSTGLPWQAGGFGLRRPSTARACVAPRRHDTVRAAQHDDRRDRHVRPADQGRGVEAGVRRTRRHRAGRPSLPLDVRRRHDLRDGDRRPRDRYRREHSDRTVRAGRPNAASAIGGQTRGPRA